MKHYEFKIGIVVVIGLFFIILGLYLTNSLPFLSTGYKIFLKLSYASNIPVGANVKLVGGIEVGRVEEVRENPGEGGVILVLSIDSRYRINRDARFVVRSASLVGERYIDILGYTGDEPYLKDGDVVVGNEETTLNEAISDVYEFIRKVIGKIESTPDLPQSIDKIVLAVAYIESILREVYQNRDTISTSLRNVSDFSENIKKSVQEINSLLNYLNQVGNNISRVDIQKLNDSIDNLNSTIIQISKLLTNTNTVIGVLTDEEVGKSLRRTIRNFEVFSKKISDNPSSLINIFR
ncbi:MAG: MlaD family protein [Spirochaetia bacterium]|nr:MlaD family protein [Spirochaetota bacterium]MDW8113216.1 MlaD family protein [Spirochaetia bacterium]